MTTATIMVLALLMVALERAGKLRVKRRNDETTTQRMLAENKCNKFDDLKEVSHFLSCIIQGVYSLSE